MPMKSKRQFGRAQCPLCFQVVLVIRPAGQPWQLIGHLMNYPGQRVRCPGSETVIAADLIDKRTVRRTQHKQ